MIYKMYVKSSSHLYFTIFAMKVILLGVQLKNMATDGNFMKHINFNKSSGYLNERKIFLCMMSFCRRFVFLVFYGQLFLVIFTLTFPHSLNLSLALFMDIFIMKNPYNFSDNIWFILIFLYCAN